MKIIKHGLKGEYYRFECPNCHCDFVADRSEIGQFGYVELININPHRFLVKCPDCEIQNTMDGIECDENGEQIIRPVKPLEVAINS